MHFLDESFWLAISFIIFIYFAYKPVRKAILSALDTKIATIKMQLTEAENLKKEAERLLDRAEQEIASLKTIKDESFRQAKITADELATKRTKEIEAQLNRRKIDTIAAIENQKLQACMEIQTELSKAITKLVQEYLKSSQDEVSDIEIARKLMDKP